MKSRSLVSCMVLALFASISAAQEISLKCRVTAVATQGPSSKLEVLIPPSKLDVVVTVLEDADGLSIRIDSGGEFDDVFYSPNSAKPYEDKALTSKTYDGSTAKLWDLHSFTQMKLSPHSTENRVQIDRESGQIRYIHSMTNNAPNPKYEFKSEKKFEGKCTKNRAANKF